MPLLCIKLREIGTSHFSESKAIFSESRNVSTDGWIDGWVDGGMDAINRSGMRDIALCISDARVKSFSL